MRRPRVIPRQAAVVASPPTVQGRKPAEVERAIAAVSEAVDRLTAGGEAYVDVDLVPGMNRLNHGLGRTPIAIEIVPRDANASFAWGFDPAQLDNPHPQRQAWITVAGTAMPARVFFR